MRAAYCREEPEWAWWDFLERFIGCFGLFCGDLFIMVLSKRDFLLVVCFFSRVPEGKSKFGGCFFCLGLLSRVFDRFECLLWHFLKVVPGF